MKRWTYGSIVVAMAVALVSTACGGGGGGGGGASSSPAQSNPAATTPGAVATSPPAAAGGQTVQQGANGALVFSPTKLSVAKGSTITVQNVSGTAHTFTIQGHGINVVNQGGKSSTVKIDLAPGTYTFICTFHVSLGMKGTLTVTG